MAAPFSHVTDVSSCVPLEDLFRTKPGVKSTQVGEINKRKDTDHTDL